MCKMLTVREVERAVGEIKPKIVKDWYREAMMAEGEVLTAIGRRYGVERNSRHLYATADVLYRTLVLDAIAMSRLARASNGDD